MNPELYMPALGPLMEFLLTRLSNWMDSRSRALQLNFHEIFNPVFDQLLVVHKDYMDMFQNTSRMLLESRNPDKAKYLEGLREVAAFLEQRRSNLEAERTKLRALAKKLADDPSEEGTFVNAVAGYLSAWPPTATGSVSLGLLHQIEQIIKQPSVTDHELGEMLDRLIVHLD